MSSWNTLAWQWVTLNNSILNKARPLYLHVPLSSHGAPLSHGVPLEQGLSRLGRCNASRVITHTMAGWINRFRSSSLFSMETNYLNRIRPYFGLHSGIFMWGWKPRWIFSARRYHQTWMGNPKEYWKVGWEITHYRLKLRWTSMSATVTKTLLIAQI